jgi:thiosulfate/3-mercaptopyruvate sulfurtransferase
MARRLAAVLAGTLVAATAMAKAPAVTPLVDAEWLASHLDNEDVIVLDIRSKIDGGGRAAYDAGHVPGAVHSSYTDDGWRTTRDGVVGMLPPVPDLEALIGSLGVDNDDAVVIVPAGVNSTDFGSAARVYWTFKVLGHDQVAILNGGHRAWVEAGRPVEQAASTRVPTTFTANVRPELIATDEEVAALREQQGVLVDSRPVEFYKGERKHPDARVAGTIPGARNLQEGMLVKGESAYFVDRAQLDRLIADAGIDDSGDKAVVTFCNTGHWASTTWFALSEIAGYSNVAMYDGSMVGWTADESRPVAVAKKGLARFLDLFK